MTFQQCGSPRVLGEAGGLGMLTAVKLNDQLVLAATEVCDEASDWNLPTKFKTLKAICS
jgi:hypothetical protein